MKYQNFTVNKVYNFTFAQQKLHLYIAKLKFVAQIKKDSAESFFYLLVLFVFVPL